MNENQEAKHDEGKYKPSLVSKDIIKGVAEVRQYGIDKYGDRDNWKTVGKQRYTDALLRHVIEYASGQENDEESGLSHLAHAACNIMFLMYFDSLDHELKKKEDEFYREVFRDDIKEVEELVEYNRTRKGKKAKWNIL